MIFDDLHVGAVFRESGNINSKLAATASEAAAPPAGIRAAAERDVLQRDTQKEDKARQEHQQ